MTMTIRDLIPWNRGRDVAVHRGERANPLLTLHREMNRVFDDVFRGFDMAPFGSDRLFDRALGWPDIEVSETDKEVKVTAELPGLEEKDVGVELANGVLAIKGEKRAETEDKDRLFSERYLWPVRAAHPGRRYRGGQGQCLVQERGADRNLAKIGQGAGEGEAYRDQRQVGPR